MKISSLEYQQMKQRLAKQNPEPEQPEPDDACPSGREVKELHDPFMDWCALHCITYVHLRTDKRSTAACGVPDFVCLYGGRYALVEFKTESGKLTKAQKEWHDTARLNGVSVLVTSSFKEATLYVAERLQSDS